MKFSEALRLNDNRTDDKRAGRREAALLLSHVTGAAQTEIATDTDRVLSAEEEEAFLKLLLKREKHVPLQYLIGKWAFMGLEFIVNPHVLIPRQDTETLVEAALKAMAGGTKDSSVYKPWRALDLCTGSGCIGIALAKLAGAEVTASDISVEALDTARRNAELNGVSGKINFIRSDLFESIPKEHYDLIISNPPYIPTGEIAGLQKEVRDYEPRSALDGGADGLDFYRRITAEAGGYLPPGGLLCFEAGPAEGIRELLRKQGYNNIETVKDLAGKERVVLCLID